MFDTEEDAKQSLLDLKFKKRVFQGALVKARLKTETVVRSFYPLQNTPPVFPVLPYGNMMGGMVPGMMAPVPGPFGYMNVPMMMPLGSLNGGVMQQQQQQQQQQMNLPIGAADYQPPPQHMIKTVSSVDRMDTMMMPSSGQAIISSTHGQTMNGTSSSPPLSNISTTHSNNNISTNNSNSNNNMISTTSSISNTNSSEEAPKPRDNRNRAQNNNIHSNTPGGAHRSSSAQGNNQQAADNRRKDGGSSNRRPISGPNGSHAPTNGSSGGGASKSSYLEKAIIEINVANFPPLNGVEDLPATSPGGKEAPSSSIDPSTTATTTAVVSSTETVSSSSLSSSTQHHESRGGANVEAAVAVGEATRSVTAGR